MQHFLSFAGLSLGLCEPGVVSLDTVAANNWSCLVSFLLPFSQVIGSSSCSCQYRTVLATVSSSILLLGLTWICFCSFFLMSDAHCERNLSLSVTCPSYESKFRVVYLVRLSLSLSKKVNLFSSGSWLIAATFEWLIIFCLAFFSSVFMHRRKWFLPYISPCHYSQS